MPNQRQVGALPRPAPSPSIEQPVATAATRNAIGWSMANFETVIRNGTIVDGSGGDPYQADTAISDGRIAAIGMTLPKGTEEIDARGKLVTPGFVDVHTH